MRRKNVSAYATGVVYVVKGGYIFFLIKYAEDNGMEILRRISNDKMNEIIIKKN